MRICLLDQIQQTLVIELKRRLRHWVVGEIDLRSRLQRQTTRNANLSHSHGSVSVVRTTFKVYGKMQTLTLSQPKSPEPIVTKF